MQKPDYYDQIRYKLQQCYENKLCGSISIRLPKNRDDLADDIVTTYKKIGYHAFADPDNKVKIFVKKF